MNKDFVGKIAYRMCRKTPSLSYGECQFVEIYVKIALRLGTLSLRNRESVVMDAVKVFGAIPFVAMGIAGIHTFIFGNCAGMEKTVLLASIALLLPSIAFMAVGMKNFAGRKDPVADAIVTGSSIIAAIICIICLLLNLISNSITTENQVQAKAEYETEDGYGWYKKESDVSIETVAQNENSSGKKQLPNDEKYWIVTHVACDDDYICITNDSYFDWEDVSFMINGKYFYWEERIDKGQNYLPLASFFSEELALYDCRSEPIQSFVVHIGDIYVDGEHFSSDEYNMGFAYGGPGDGNSGSSRIEITSN